MNNWIISLVLALSILTGCQQKQSPSTPTKDVRSEFVQLLKDELKSNEVQVVDVSLNPVAGAILNTSTSIMETDSNGIAIISKAWTGPEDVTIVKSGITTTTYIAQLPEKNVFVVKNTQRPLSHEVKGITNGYPNLAKDGWIDFSMVVKPFTQADIMTFDISKVISDQNDTVSVMGREMDIPSNISIPKQKESYAFFSITLDKPLYRTYFDSTGPKSLAATRGRFELKKVVDKFQNGAAFYDVVNDFKFQSAEVTHFNLNSMSQKLDLNTTQYSLTPSIQHKAPNYDPNLLYFTASTFKTDGQYIPADIKSYKPSESLTMLAPGKSESSFVLAMFAEKKQVGKNVTISPKMSLTLSSSDEAQGNLPLDVIPEPLITGNTVKVMPPSIKADVTPIGTYISLMRVTKTSTQQSVSEVKSVIAESYASTWISEFAIPAQNLQALGGTDTYRIEVTFLGTRGKPLFSTGPLQMSDATHASRNALDFN